MYTVHLDTLGTIHNLRWIAETWSLDIKKRAEAGFDLFEKDTENKLKPATLLGN
jgi:hypothetical protein